MDKSKHVKASMAEIGVGRHALQMMQLQSDKPFHDPHDVGAPRLFVANDPNGSAIELASGIMFDPLDPEPGLMTIEDIAASQSNTCRFGGHVKRNCYLSTAQHSVLVALLAPKEIDIQRYAILHDADESFGIPDFPTPVKKVFPAVKSAQERIGEAVEERFDLDPHMHKLVKVADRQALYLERLACKHRTPENEATWLQWLGNAPVPVGVAVIPLQPEDAYDLFMAAYERVFEQDLPITREWLATRKGFALETSPEFMPGL
ncbi:hypothetical protein ACEUZ9_000896 [Paracoccus litorisediminis]|uniref:hypothetical protein n=1 Tax=Paracoccus litorisediminis TaxID=2006130 RepID=UPI003732F005